MKKILFYVFVPVMFSISILGLGLTFGFLSNFLEYQKFEKLYDIENGKPNKDAVLPNKYNILFNNQNSINGVLNEYNGTVDKKEFLNSKLSVVFNSNTINMNNLNQEIINLKEISLQQISVWEEYKRQNILVDNFNWSIFQTINYFDVLNSLTYQKADNVPFWIGVAILIPSFGSFVGFIAFYYTSKKHGISSELDDDSDNDDNNGFASDDKEENSDNNLKISHQPFDKLKTINTISNSSEMKSYLDNKRDVGFKNPILQKRTDTKTSEILISESKKNNSKKINFDLTAFMGKKKKKNKKLSKRQIDKILQGD